MFAHRARNRLRLRLFRFSLHTVVTMRMYCSIAGFWSNCCPFLTGIVRVWSQALLVPCKRNTAVCTSLTGLLDTTRLEFHRASNTPVEVHTYGAYFRSRTLDSGGIHTAGNLHGLARFSLGFSLCDQPQLALPHGRGRAVGSRHASLRFIFILLYPSDYASVPNVHTHHTR